MVNYPKDWEENNLGNLAFIKTGNKNNEDKVSGGKYPFYVRSEKVERINTFSYDTEAILVPGEGNIGSVFHYVNGKFDVHQRVYAITNFSDTLNAKYLYWYMVKNFGSYALSQTSKATVDSLRLPAFKNFCVVIPPLPEQQAIADALTAFDTHINNLAKLIAKKKMIRDGALEALISGRYRIAPFNKPFVMKNLCDIATIQDGTHGTFKRVATGFLLLSAKNVFNNKLVIGYDESRVTIEDYKKITANGYPQKGDILLSCVGTIGRCCILEQENMAFQRSVAFIRTNFCNKYLTYVLQSSVIQEQLQSMVNASAQGGIYLGSLKKLN